MSQLVSQAVNIRGVPSLVFKLPCGQVLEGDAAKLRLFHAALAPSLPLNKTKVVPPSETNGEAGERRR